MLQTVIISQTLDSINHIEINGDEMYEYEEKRIKLKNDINQGYLELKKFFKYRSKIFHHQFSFM